ncbi:hypothetical protein J4558_00195 [Leptolyngbya sp. 15MV]|nr:hypothetical protein J4558_00195 [Leptolyngbya sp. 15MV]
MIRVTVLHRTDAPRASVRDWHVALTREPAGAAPAPWTWRDTGRGARFGSAIVADRGRHRRDRPALRHCHT